jgi:hypothetical protein
MEDLLSPIKGRVYKHSGYVTTDEMSVLWVRRFFVVGGSSNVYLRENPQIEEPFRGDNFVQQKFAQLVHHPLIGNLSEFILYRVPSSRRNNSQWND